nr:MAG TPA: helix-turn-helix domain protein [Caudoviricetes sp.]
MPNRIKMLREQEGLKQADLAVLLNVTQATLSNWECGRYEPDQDSLKILSKRFDVSIDYLLGMSDSPLNVYNAQNIHNSNFVQGNGSVSVCEIDPTTKEETELLRIYRELDVRGRLKLMNAAFDVEEEYKSRGN